MKKEHLYFLIAFILFSIVILDTYWWLKISTDSSKPFEQMKSEYFEKVPDIFGKGHGMTYFSILLLIISCFLFFKSKSEAKLYTISKILLICCLIIGAWQCNSLM